MKKNIFIVIFALVACVLSSGLTNVFAKESEKENTQPENILKVDYLNDFSLVYCEDRSDYLGPESFIVAEDGLVYLLDSCGNRIL